MSQVDINSTLSDVFSMFVFRKWNTDDADWADTR